MQNLKSGQGQPWCQKIVLVNAKNYCFVRTSSKHEQIAKKMHSKSEEEKKQYFAIFQIFTEGILTKLMN